jgi:cupin fold WbuC family metalloprotein
LKAIYAVDINELLEKARKSPRRRAIFSPHSEKDPVNFFYNALMPGTYVQPHRHEEKNEYFQIVRGEVFVVVFGDNGEIKSAEMLSGETALSCRILPGEWHSVIALEESVILEVKLGPYDPATAKTFAPWAPSEADAKSISFLDDMNAKAVHVYYSTA